MKPTAKPSKPIIRFTSLSLEKLLQIQQNLSKPPSPPSIWHHRHPPDHHHDPPTLTLTHPILSLLESSTPNSPQFHQIHAQLLLSGLFQHPLAAGRLVKKLCSHPTSIPRAVSLFALLDEPDAFICNTIIRSYVNSHDPHSAFSFFCEQMVQKCITPNHYTFPLLAKICAELGFVREGAKTHARVVKCGLELDLCVRNSMIYMYSTFGEIGDARKVFDLGSDLDLVSWNSMIDGYVKNGELGVARVLFDGMPDRDIVSWNSMIAGYVGAGDMEGAQGLFEKIVWDRDVVSWNLMIDGYARIGDVSVARGLFDRMKKRNVVSWNAMLALYARNKDSVECLRLFDKMMEEVKVKPNEATLVSALSACANLGKLDRGKLIHDYMRDDGRIEQDVLLSTALLTMYAKCGDMDLAREVFNEMPERSVVSWNSMIMGYGMHGHGDKALEMFLDMEKSGETPNAATFVCILSACTHAGMVLEGWWYFDLMRRVYKIEPKVEHYGCMVDLLGRAGLVKDSEELVQKMPIEGGSALWGALLSSCNTHLNFELGEMVGKRLIESEPSDIGAYVLLSNIYAMLGKWESVEKMRRMMVENGLLKTAGYSLVDITGSKESELFSEDKYESNHKRVMIHSMLMEMSAQIKLCKDGGKDN